MATGTGLDAQVGFKLESTWGTPVVVDKFVEFDSEGLAWTPTFVEPTGLRVGQKFKRGSRLVRSRETVEGDVTMQFATRTMGTLVKAMLGSAVTTPTVIAGSAYKQVHTPGDFVGKSLTVQVGRPEPSGTVRAHTYEGCKVTGWEIAVSDGETATLKLTLDGQTELTATALATASFVTSEVFNFSQVTVFKLGGTASTAAGEVSVASGVTVTTIIKGITITGTTPLATERYGLGNARQKAEQLENDTPTITGTLDAEFNRTEVYDLFKANTATALELKLEGSIISGSDKNTLHIIIPEIHFKTAAPNVDGPDVVQMSVDFEGYQDATGNAPIQVKLISADSAAL